METLRKLVRWIEAHKFVSGLAVVFAISAGVYTRKKIVQTRGIVSDPVVLGAAMGILAKQVAKCFGTPPVRALDGIFLEIKDGEFVALKGRSGSGKSTLLYLISSLDSPSEGSIEISGQDVTKMISDALHRLRNEQIGFVFQFHYLIAELSMIENVMMPALKFGQADKHRAYAEHLLDQFGLANKLHRKPRELSGGEQQRVAIARAMAMEPKYLFADEPTGSLDSASGENVMNIIRDINQRAGTTVVMVTHDPDFAALAKRQIQLVDGRIVGNSL